MTTVAILVNSCLSYHRSTLPPLLGSLHRAGVHSGDVFAVVGDAPTADTGRMTTDDGYEARLWFVPWSNIDDTALIWAVSPEGRDVLRDREWVFYLHDTTTVMPKFGHEVLARTPSDDVPAVPLRQFPSMSMGYYHLPALWAAGDANLLTPNDDTSERGRTKLKNAPGAEDGVFRLLLGRDQPGRVLNPHGCAVHTDVSPYGGVPRIKETWDVPGVYKFKANWGQSSHLVVSL